MSFCYWELIQFCFVQKTYFIVFQSFKISCLLSSSMRLAFVFCRCRKNTWFPISWLNTIQMDYLTASLGPELSMAGWGSPPRVSNGKNQVLARAAVSSGHGGTFQAHSGCWQSLVPNDTGNEVPSSCWLSTRGLLEAIHRSLPHDSKTWQRPHHGQQEMVSAVWISDFLSPWPLDPDLRVLCDEVRAAQTISPWLAPNQLLVILVIPSKVLLPYNRIQGVVFHDIR